MKPETPNESHLRGRYAHPHDVCVNGDEGRRIARRRWKSARSKYLRRLRGRVAPALSPDAVDPHVD